MNKLVRKIARRARTVPGLGRLVRIAAAVARLPELRADIIALRAGSYEHDPRTQPALWRALDELRENTSGDANLARSVPVALRRLTREVHALRQRLEVAESVAGIQTEPPAAGERMPGLFVFPEQAAAAAGARPRLYLGSGEPAPAGYVLASTDDTGGALPLTPGAAGEIRLAWLCETFTQAELRQHLLPQLYAGLAPGGRLQVLALDAGAALAAYAAGELGYEALRDTLYGAPERDGRLQLNMLSPASLATLLGEAGFAVTDTVDTGARDGRRFGFELTAIKPMPGQAAH